LLAGLRRLLVLLVGSAVALGAVAALVAVLVGADVGRGVALAYYIVGAFLLVLGFFAGVRGPLRPRAVDESNAVTGIFGVGVSMRGARKATTDERQDSVATAGLFITTALWLILLGVVVDGSVSIV
jgi:hypothetical protein